MSRRNISKSEFTIDELAREAGTTVRNVRAYQERGLLPPPRREGRAGLYSESHLGRLRIIASLLERGYSLANVAELIEAWEGGQDIGSLLGLEAAVTSPWTDEAPVTISFEQLQAMFGEALDAGVVARAVKLGGLSIEADGVRVPNMKLLTIAAMLIKEGVPFDLLLTLEEHLRGHVEQIAEELVRLVSTHIFDRYGKDALPPPSEAPRLAKLIEQLRPMAMEAVNVEVAAAMKKASDKHLGDKLAQALEHLHATPSNRRLRS
ncbi:MAG TPA: MerR family transcriptional regulator [Rhizomicrobium sp.]